MRAFKFVSRWLYTAACLLYALTIGILCKKNRELIADVSRRFGYDPYNPLAKLPEVALDSLVSGDAAIEVLEPRAVDGNVTLYELAAINRVVKSTDPAAIFELGTFDGRTTLNLAANCRDGAKVYTLDLPADKRSEAALKLAPGDASFIDKPASGARFQGSPRAAKITQLYGDSASFDYAPYLGKIDLVFVDAAHSYEYVMADTKTAFKLLRGGKGVILWHDYTVWEGVTRVLNELYASEPSFAGIKRIAGTTLAYLAAKDAATLR